MPFWLSCANFVITIVYNLSIIFNTYCVPVLGGWGQPRGKIVARACFHRAQDDMGQDWQGESGVLQEGRSWPCHVEASM
jgi:hypothetical protein